MSNTHSKFKMSLLAELMFRYLYNYYKDDAPNGADNCLSFIECITRVIYLVSVKPL